MKFLLIVPLIYVSTIASAQSIGMDFPAFAGKTYEFIIFQGSKAEKVLQDTIPQNGKFKLTIPAQYTPYTGMCRWLLTNSEHGGGIDMAIPGYDFSISCSSDKPDITNITYTGFDAVNELNRLYSEQQKIINKYQIMSTASKLYDKSHSLFLSFQKEKELQAKAYEEFQEDLKKNSNYNARFLPIVNLVSGFAHRLSDIEEEKGQFFNEFFVQKMNINDLYVSGHWDGIIHSWVEYQANVVNDKTKFVQDFKLLNDKIKNPTQYTDFVGKITFYLIKYGKDDYIDAITPLVIKSGRITSYEGKTMQIYKTVMVGNRAPDIIITEHIGKVENHKHKKTIIKSKHFALGKMNKTLLVYYQSGCGPCEELLQQLRSKYQELLKNDIDIIAISADENKQIFENTSKDFPWNRTYCDFEGINGINFKNYSAIGTPIMFLINKSGIIERKLAGLKNINELNK